MESERHAEFALPEDSEDVIRESVVGVPVAAAVERVRGVGRQDGWEGDAQLGGSSGLKSVHETKRFSPVDSGCKTRSGGGGGDKGFGCGEGLEIFAILEGGVDVGEGLSSEGSEEGKERLG